MQSLFAFLHHVAAFALVGALAAEFVLIRGELIEKTAARMLAADAVYGASAGIVLVVGLLRVFYFEKGAAYYLHSIPFLLKFSLVVMTYERQAGLRKCLQSLTVLDYSRGAFEVVVIDDGSSADNASIVSDFSERLLIRYRRIEHRIVCETSGASRWRA